MNKCYFTGRMAKDVEISYTNDNKAIGRFPFAVDNGYGDNKRTSFFNCVAWENTATTLEKCTTKGTKLLLECEAVQNQYTDKNGNKRNTVDFTVRNFEFCERKGASDSSTQSRPEPSAKADSDGFMSVPTGIDDELPFM